jgi:hypothetical protein
MGLNVSNEQIAHELSINESDAYQRTTALRGGIIKLDCCILGDGRSLHVAMTVCCLANK